MIILNHMMGVFLERILEERFPDIRIVCARLSSQSMHKNQFQLTGEWIRKRMSPARVRAAACHFCGRFELRSFVDQGNRRISDSWLLSVK